MLAASNHRSGLADAWVQLRSGAHGDRGHSNAARPHAPTRDPCAPPARLNPPGRQKESSLPCAPAPATVPATSLARRPGRPEFRTRRSSRGANSTPRTAHFSASDPLQKPQNFAPSRLGCPHPEQTPEPPPVVTFQRYRAGPLLPRHGLPRRRLPARRGTPSDLPTPVPNTWAGHYDNSQNRVLYHSAIADDNEPTAVA
jgi:hypothetical protein